MATGIGEPTTAPRPRPVPEVPNPIPPSIPNPKR